MCPPSSCPPFSLKEFVPDELLLEGVGVSLVVSEVELEFPGLDLKGKLETITIPVNDFETHLTSQLGEDPQQVLGVLPLASWCS